MIKLENEATQAVAAGASPVSIFNNPEFGSVRIITREDGEPLFCLRDVALCLGYKDTSDAIKTRCDEGSVIYLPLETAGGKQQVKFGPESEVYRLIFGSKLDSAKKFQDWVFKEVLPSIRKTGSYSYSEPTRESLRSSVLNTLATTIASIEHPSNIALQILALNTGLTLPPHEIKKNMTVTEWSKMYGDGDSAIKCNKLFECFGLVARLGKRWKPTTKGSEYFEENMCGDGLHYQTLVKYDKAESLAQFINDMLEAEESEAMRQSDIFISAI